MVVFFDRYQTNKNGLAAIKWSWALACSKSGDDKQACRSNHAQNDVIEMAAKVRSICCSKRRSGLAFNRFRALLFIQKVLMPMFGSKPLFKGSGKNGAKKKIAGATALNDRKTGLFQQHTRLFIRPNRLCSRSYKQIGYKFFKKINRVLKIRSHTLGFFQLAAIRRIKAWLCGVYSRMRKKHMEKNPDEFSFRKNQSGYRQPFFIS